MLLQRVALHNFRNYLKKSFTFNPFLTIIIGENARGKTNILESVYFIMNGHGFRESKESELIYFDEKQGSVEAVFQNGDKNLQFKIQLLLQGELVSKAFFFNKTKKRFHQYHAEQIRAILFAPEQILIITGNPSERREYFNRLLSSLDLDYKKKLVNYEHALRRRNKILEKHSNELQLKEELKFWDDYVIESGSYLTKKRQEYVEYLNRHSKLEDREFSIEYMKNEITQDRLTHYFEKEKIVRRTLIGPQKDDFQISLLNKHIKNIHHFGSRSEQRLGILWLKMTEIRYYEEYFKQKPILLFDDIFSELDLHNRGLVLKLVKKYQTVLTTTEKEMIELIEVPKTIISL